MIISKYSKIFKRNKDYYLYNSLSNYFCSINENLYDFLLKKKQSSETIERNEFLIPEMWDTFINKRIICENNFDDFIEFKSIIESQRRQDNQLMITIAPTLECNFECPYCFENKTIGYMNKKTISNVIDFINLYEKVDLVFITWFGGEPLLYPEIIKYFNDKIKKLNSKRIVQNIITNGYYLNEENIKMLNRYEIKTIQLTIDGLKENHNVKKFTKVDSNTYQTILKNIDTFCRLNFDINLNIRINIDKNNYEDYFEIFQFLSEKYNNSKISVYPAFIINNSNMNCKDLCFENNSEKFSFYKEFALRLNIANFIYPSNDITECATRNAHSWIIDPKGDLYKCWEIIGNSNYKVGEICENGKIKITDYRILNRYLNGSDPLNDANCLNCFYLPICRGGCPHKRIENDFNNASNICCTYFKNEINNYLTLKSKLS